MSLKKRLANIVGGTFIPKLFRNYSKGSKIVFYHGITDEPISNNMIQANQMSLNDFKKQIEFYLNEYEIISIEEFSKRFEDHMLSGNELVITFDDGYKNNLKIVAPYLKEKNIPFTVFICPDLSAKGLRVPTYYVRLAIYGTNNKVLEIRSLDRVFSIATDSDRDTTHKELIHIVKTANYDIVKTILEDILKLFTIEELTFYNNKYSTETLLTIEEIRELSQNYPCTIASHCLDHAILHNNQHESEIDKQLFESKKLISNIVGCCDYFAFPNGDLNSVCDYSIKKAGLIYRFGFAVNGRKVGYSDKNGYISRIGVAPDFNVFKIQMLILSGLK